MRVRRILTLSTVLALFSVLVGSATIASTPTGHAAATGHASSNAARGLIYEGLRHRPSGPCGNLYQATSRFGKGVLCTHGPDAAPAGIDVRVRRPLATSAAAAAPTAPIPCIGDGVSGPRVHAIYAVSSDVTDRYDATLESIRRWAAAVEGVVEESAAETGGTRQVRWLTQPTATGCELVVDKVIMGTNGDSSNVGDTVSELRKQGFIRPDRRYLVWVDANVLCGIGGLFGDESPGLTNANNGAAPLYSRIDNSCWGLLDQNTSGPNFVSVEAHELMHNFGAVQQNAPNSTGRSSPTTTAGGHCTDEWDAMCYDDDSQPSTFELVIVCADEAHGPLLDCNHDDYFSTAPLPNSYLDTNWNTADSIFFVGSPFPITQKLRLTKSGAGSGTVTAQFFELAQAQAECEAGGGNCDWVDQIGNLGISCGQFCAADISTNTRVVLVPDAGGGSSFAEWSGECAGVVQRDGQEACVVEMSQARDVNARFARSGPQPDGEVGRKNGGPYVGEDIYNSTGSRQTSKARVKKGKSATFFYQVENDGTVTDNIKVKGSGNPKGFTVSYFLGGQNITQAMIAGVLSLNGIPPNARIADPIKIVLKAKSSTASGKTGVVKITATSKNNSQRVDVVKASAKVS